jgi:hypothetical protein
VSLATQVSAAFVRVATEFKTVYSREGNLANLTTTTKTDLVSAVNEVNAKPTGVGGASINDAAPASTSTTYSASKIEANDATKAALSHTHTASQISDASTTIVTLAGAQTIAGAKTFSVAPAVPASSFAIDRTSGLQAALDAKAVIADASATTATTTTYSANKINAAITAAQAVTKADILGAGVPTALDTLDELAAALGDDANFAATTTTALGNRLRIDGTAQTIIAANQLQARTNIAAAGSTDMGDPATDFVAVFVAALA